MKRADIGHNSDPERLAALEPKKAESLAHRYEKALAILDSCEAAGWKPDPQEDR
ncbi:hypothetical protein OG884_33700 [Streptosporangium sp. NBC_01755]|uniref:hypothetical protein n=1 Tax=unclassified Streptosporangium TaxID=2632669 RepID=UPI002DD85043|nr:MULTISPECIES: hypothetical protein [unclassified Streptosporangium]WSA28849.1 hypothetical protein OIE13_13785 [Streptosporangium sp. NBC_01810]WSC99705.1 hypothetical protein OG884_33700 [Streptosporangium sp. NBC_01755]